VPLRPKLRGGVGRGQQHRSASFLSSATQEDDAMMLDGERGEAPARQASSRRPAATFARPSVTSTGTLMPSAEWYPAWMRYRWGVEVSASFSRLKQLTLHPCTVQAHIHTPYTPTLCTRAHTYIHAHTLHPCIHIHTFTHLTHPRFRILACRGSSQQTAPSLKRTPLAPSHICLRSCCPKVTKKTYESNGNRVRLWVHR
jgi:hypothetical protein